MEKQPKGDHFWELVAIGSVEATEEDWQELMDSQSEQIEKGVVEE